MAGKTYLKVRILRTVSLFGPALFQLSYPHHKFVVAGSRARTYGIRMVLKYPFLSLHLRSALFRTRVRGFWGLIWRPNQA